MTLVLQEADRRIGMRRGVLPLERLENELGYWLPDVSVRPLSHGWHGNAIFVDKKYKDAVPSRIDLPTLEPRGAISVRLPAPQIEIIGVHLGLTPRVRQRQMASLRERLQNPAHPVILAGDFNEWNVTRLQQPQDFKIVAPGPSYHALRPIAPLDVFMLSSDIEVVSTHVHKSTLAERASDHLPVVVDIEIKEPAP